MRNVSGQSGENERQWKRKRKHRKFHVIVVEQQRQRNVQKSVFTCKVVFLLIRPIVGAIIVVVVIIFFFAVLNAVAV